MSKYFSRLGCFDLLYMQIQVDVSDSFRILIQKENNSGIIIYVVFRLLTAPVSWKIRHASSFIT